MKRWLEFFNKSFKLIKNNLFVSLFIGIGVIVNLVIRAVVIILLISSLSFAPRKELKVARPTIIPTNTLLPTLTSTVRPTNTPIVTNAPIILPSATATNVPTNVPPTQIPTLIPQPTDIPPTTVPPTNNFPTDVPAAVCDCSGNILNCGDFSSQHDAQSCFEYCWQVTGNDVHGFDVDNDNLACESLP